MPNLDAGDESTYQKVNRLHRDISFDVMVEGLISFRKTYKQQYWLEVFLLESITANDSQIDKMVKIADRISPDRIQLNTVTRPTQKYCPSAVSKEKMDYSTIGSEINLD
jgi:GTP-binding protein